MFSQTTEYALRAMVVLADSNQPRTAAQVSARAQVPSSYLSKVMQSLVRAGLVHAQRGKHGGFVLAGDAKSISILNVVNAVDPIRRIGSCPLGIPQHGGTLCALHRRLDSALGMVEDAFRGTTLAELIGQPGRSKPLCGGIINVQQAG